MKKKDEYLSRSSRPAFFSHWTCYSLYGVGPQKLNTENWGQPNMHKASVGADLRDIRHSQVAVTRR